MNLAFSHNNSVEGLMIFRCSSRFITQLPSTGAICNLRLRSPQSRTQSNLIVTHVIPKSDQTSNTLGSFQFAMSSERASILSPEEPTAVDPGGQPDDDMDVSELFSGSMPKEEIGALRFLKVRTKRANV